MQRSGLLAARPTIKEVARLANVAVGTVSNVITGSVPVSEELQQRVLTAIRELDYHPNHVARSLKTSRTRTLGIIVPDLTISFYPQVIRGAETAARQRKYSLIAVNSYDSAERQEELLSLLRSERVEGILLVAAAAPAQTAVVARVVEAGIPVVCLDRILDKIHVDSVSVEDAAAAQMGVEHLAAMGNRRIAIITGPMTLKNERDRLRGCRTAMRRAKLTLDELMVWHGDLNRDHVAALCSERLHNPATRPDAIFSTNGPTGLGVLRALRDCGLRTPEDIRFATFDELVVEDVFSPSITTVVQPSYEIGSRAAEILLSRIEKKLRTKPVSLRLPASLNIRRSSQVDAPSAVSALVSAF
jgi:DNA-binding LacI/PurR family transcriptional regulator